MRPKLIFIQIFKSPAARSSAFELDPNLKIFRNPLLMGLKKSLMGLKRLRKKLPKTWASVAAGSRRIKAKRRMSPLLLEERVVSSLGF